MSAKAGTAIIGGGIVGLCVALGLAARGHEVLVLDGRDGDMRASQGNFGLVWLQGKGAGYAPYARWSYQAAQAWPAFAQRLSGLADVDLALCQQGGYEFFTDAAEYEAFGQDLHRQARALDDRFSFELLNHADLAARLPGIGQGVVGASFCPLDGHVNPLRLHFALRQTCLASGVRITGGASVAAVCPAGEGFAILDETGHQTRAERVILCAGLGAAQLGPQLGFRAPIRAQRGELMITERVRDRLPFLSSTIRQVDEGGLQIGGTKAETDRDTEITATMAGLAQPFLKDRHDRPKPSDLAFIRFVSVENMMRLVNGIGVETVLRDLARYIEDDFRRWTLFDKTPRVASHSAEGVIELMPTSDGVSYGFKYVNGHPKNTKSGLQTVTAFGLLPRVDTGYPELLTEMTLLTALRTAATSAMVARHLAPKGATTMAMIGNGAQSEFQALAMRAICGISELRLYDIDPAATEKLMRNLSGLGIGLTACKTAQEATLGAQIITTCTADKQYATILTDNMVGSGVHINAIGGDCPGKTELHGDILRRSDVFVEYTPQTRIEGEIQQMPEDFPVTEMWQVIAGTAPGRTSDRQITLFDGVGFAIEDFSALRYVRDRLEGTGLYQRLDIIADPDDPRDLFGMLTRAVQG